MNLKGDPGEVDESAIDIADKWILMRTNSVIREVTDCMDKFDLGLAAQKIYDFAWSEFCDWYIEMAKPRLYGEDEAVGKTGDGRAGACAGQDAEAAASVHAICD